MARAPAATVLRAIESARPFVDSVCLVVAPGDPLEGLALPMPGRIVSQPWLGYAETRTATLRHAEQDPGVDWIVMIDAHARLRGTMPALDVDVDAYEIAIESNFPDGTWRWMRRGHLMRARRGLHWVGAIHEVLAVPDETRVKMWHGLVYEGEASGTRDYAGDVSVLREEIVRDPSDTRAAFYYAQSLKDAGRLDAAFSAFLARARMGGFAEEVFWSWLWAGKLARNESEALALFEQAARHSPDRAEPHAYQRAIYGDDERGRAAGARAESKPYPLTARLFVDVWAYSDEARAAAGVGL